VTKISGTLNEDRNTFVTCEWYKWPTRCNNNNVIDLWISSTCFGQSFARNMLSWFKDQ